jgi:hypothetical protein
LADEFLVRFPIFHIRIASQISISNSTCHTITIQFMIIPTNS